MRKFLITFVTCAVIAICVFGVGILADPTVAPPQPLTTESPCPAAACASGVCHGFDNVPTPDGIHEMTCPEAGCAHVECHAWESLVNRYHQASDASLNAWILAPVILVAGLILLVRKAK